MVEFEIVDIEKEENMQVIIGHAGFIKTVEDLHEALASSVPGIKFGVAFVEASGKRLVRYSGNDSKLQEFAYKNIMKVNAGHSFIIMFTDAYPINVMHEIKSVSEVSRIYAATSNPLRIVIAKDSMNRSIIGVMDGSPAVGIENDEDKAERYKLLRDFGYKI
ncbi:MAG: adenosine-specific kinase [Candidatus Micrarchaeaceae archaeon]